MRIAVAEKLKRLSQNMGVNYFDKFLSYFLGLRSGQSGIKANILISVDIDVLNKLLCQNAAWHLKCSEELYIFR